MLPRLSPRAQLKVRERFLCITYSLPTVVRSVNELLIVVYSVFTMALFGSLFAVCKSAVGTGNVSQYAGPALCRVAAEPIPYRM